MNEIKGDLIELAKEGYFDIIVHGCNCFNAMGAGIALSIKKEFPNAWKADQATRKGDRNKLGTFTYSLENIEGRDLMVVNAYTQYGYGKFVDLFEYEEFQKILDILKENYSDKRIGMPLIGCGLAGGNKEKIMQMIQDTLPETIIVEYQPTLKFKI